MKSFTLSMAAAACGGILSGAEPEAPIGRIVIDSRAVAPGELFAAYRGENTDGHRYIASALEKGAVCALGEYRPEGVDGPMLLVDDVQRAVEQIAAAYRETLRLPVVGVTGSVGKTTTKEMIAAVLGQRFRVLKTEGNLNNQIGVPMTVSRIEREHEAAVVEMGISDFGEMTRLAAIARPTVAVFTVIGRAHLEFLHDLEGVFRAKTEMLSGMPANGTVVVNGDDPWLAKLSCPQRLVRCGFGEACELRALDTELLPEGITRCRIAHPGGSFSVEIPAFGRQLVSAALEAAAVGLALGLTEREIADGIASYQIVGRRGVIFDTGSVTLIDDSYNANPESMRCAIDSLTALPGRHVCVLADMLEMGPESAGMHLVLGQYAKEKGAALVLCTGELGREIARGAGDAGRWYPTVDELNAALPALLRKGDGVLVKASRGMRMERAAERIKELSLT